MFRKHNKIMLPLHCRKMLEHIAEQCKQPPAIRPVEALRSPRKYTKHGTVKSTLATTNYSLMDVIQVDYALPISLHFYSFF